MKIKILTILAAMTAFFGIKVSAQESETLFPYPTVPEDKATLSERCNYLVMHFWERCNIKQSFSTLRKLDEAFGAWIGFMPYATTDTVFLSIDSYIQNVAKTGADNLLEVAKMAEKHTYSDSCEIFSEELYAPFCKAVVDNKKIKKDKKAYYQKQLNILESSGLGKNVPSFEFEKPDGSKANFGEVVASRVILFFYDPNDFNSTLTKARLAADYNLSQLLENGLVKVVCIYPQKPTEEWKQTAAAMPEGWIVGATDEIQNMFSLSVMPSLYYLDARHKVLGKDIAPDNLLLGLRQINQQINKKP